MKILVAKAYKRAREDNKGTKFRFRGREMDREKMDRFKKRTTQEEELASPSACRCSHSFPLLLGLTFIMQQRHLVSPSAHLLQVP